MEKITLTPQEGQRNTIYMNQQDNNTGVYITSYHDSRNSAHLYENNEQVHESHTNITFSPISTVGQPTESCESTQVVSSSELPVETNIEINMIHIESSGQLINATNTHKDDNTSTCSVDSDGFSPTGTQEDFLQIAVDFRHCEKDAFVRGLVQDGRMVEIEIGDKPDTLKVITKNSSNQADYDILRQFMLNTTVVMVKSIFGVKHLN